MRATSLDPTSVTPFDPGVRPALLVAHPDDESLALGATMADLPGLTLIHATTGVPRHTDDPARHGLSPDAYGALREAELRAALAAAGFRGTRHPFAFPDGELVLHLPALLAALLPALRDVDAVLTHAYEGGHPDHDACALAARLAADHLGLPLYEFPLYHAAPGHLVPQRFLPGGPPELPLPLPPAAVIRKRGALACFASQSATLAAFDPAREPVRPAPRHDFAAPPHPGPLNYELWNWPLTGEDWRRHAAGMLPGKGSGDVEAARPCRPDRHSQVTPWRP